MIHSVQNYIFIWSNNMQNLKNTFDIIRFPIAACMSTVNKQQIIWNIKIHLFGIKKKPINCIASLVVALHSIPVNENRDKIVIFYSLHRFVCKSNNSIFLNLQRFTVLTCRRYWKCGVCAHAHSVFNCCKIDCNR